MYDVISVQPCVVAKATNKNLLRLTSIFKRVLYLKVPTSWKYDENQKGTV